MKLIYAFLFLSFSVIEVTGQVPIFFPGSTWKYNSASAPLPTWNTNGFDDSAWPAGAAELGYGDGDEVTDLYPGISIANYSTYYFRKTINIPDTSLYPGGYIISLQRDDGIVLYVNGVEVYRNNIFAAIPNYSEYALDACLDDGNTWYNVYVEPQFFANGNNVIAAEVHQHEINGGDLSFDGALNGINNTIPICIRGPYLQSCTDNSTTIKWRTNLPSNSKVKIGNAYGIFTDSVMNPVHTFDHEIKISGLIASAQYYYTIGDYTNIIAQDTNKYFYTPDIAGNTYELDLWVTGDCGTGFMDQQNTANAFSNYMGNKYVDAWLILGDNAYQSGFDADYQANFFDIYKQYRFMSQTCIWPTPGNHDYYNTFDLNSRTTPYFNIFTVPVNGEAGGLPSGSEAYYSYNLSNVHFISMDSYGTENAQKMYDTTSAQAQWLKQDLAANTQTWTVVYWHHPPYTMGNHNSDLEAELVSIRSVLLQLLETYQVDLVLCGHSHNYERSKLMKGHYGLEASFDSSIHQTSHSTGLYDGSNNSCPYVKQTTTDVNTGIVYVVSGNSGKHTGTSAGWPHNAMYYSNNANTGSMYFNINNNRLDAKFISESGIILDQFTMMKDVNNSYNLLVPPLTYITLTASWPGNYYWENTADTTRSVQMSFDHDSIVVVHDTLQCVADTFHVKIGYFGNEEYGANEIHLYPNPTNHQFTVKLPSLQNDVILEIFTLQGQGIFQKKWFATDSKILVDPGIISPGTYLVSVTINKHRYYCRLVMN